MILVVGATGMLGQDLMARLGSRALGVGSRVLDITRPDEVRSLLQTMKPEVVVNAAAYTDVDGCESHREQALLVNGHGVRNLAEAANGIGALLVQISSDYVFDGGKGSPWQEDDPVGPLSVYGQSKLLGEENARLAEQHLIIRTQWLFGLGGKNFVETMLTLGAERRELSVVDDQTGSPTWTADLAEAVDNLISAGCRGIYHAASSGSCTWNGFARTIFELAGLDLLVRPISSEQLGRPAPRPAYSVLDCAKLERDTGHRMPDWRAALVNYLTKRGA